MPFNRTTSRLQDRQMPSYLCCVSKEMTEEIATKVYATMDNYLEAKPSVSKCQEAKRCQRKEFSGTTH